MRLLSVFLLSFHSLFVVMAVPLALNNSDTSSPAPLPQESLILTIERFKRLPPNHTLKWRLRFGATRVLIPELENEKWKFRFLEPTDGHRMVSSSILNPIRLGTFDRLKQDKKTTMKLEYLELRCDSPQALMNAALGLVDNEFESVMPPESSPPATSEPLPDVTFTFAEASGNPDVWALYRDSKLAPDEFRKRHGNCNPTNWVQCLEFSCSIDVYLERMGTKPSGFTLTWRFWLGDAQYFYPVVDSGKWSFKGSEKTARYRTRPYSFHLGAFENVYPSQKKEMEKMFLDMEGMDSESLLQTAMDTVSPETSPSSGFSLSPGFEFIRNPDSAEVWNTFHDSQKLNAEEFWMKYSGGEPRLWIEVLVKQRQIAKKGKKRQRVEGETAD
ncbi:hypothetical protein C8R42DRAFT_758084 [Lentinula raphanica]|nr:hypothetical protein C8R42DRAFT_758084 [Lentinula raphanica]